MSTAALVLALEPLTRNTGAKLVRELRNEVVVDAVLHGAEDNDGSRVANWDRKSAECPQEDTNQEEAAVIQM